MSTGRSREDFVRFLDYLGEKGLVPSATAASRRATANTVLAILSPEEASDVTSVDVDATMTRFHNLQGQKYSPESIQTYRSRLRTSLEDFAQYLTNPLGFKPAGANRIRPRATGGAEKTKTVRSEPAPHIPPSSSRPAASVDVLPIAVRQNLTVQIAGLPFDLTKAEAQRIANIILAHAAS